MVSMADSFNVGLPPLLKQHMANMSRDANSTTGMPAFMDSLLSTASHASPLVQLVLVLYRFIGNQFGIDPSVLLTALGFIWAASKFYGQLSSLVMHTVHRYFICSINVSEDDDIFRYLMKWMAQHPGMKRNKYLTAQTVWKSAWDDDDEEDDDVVEAKSLFWTNGGDDEGTGNKYLNFSNQAARSAPRFVPAIGGSTFWHRGHYFQVYRSKESFASTRGWGMMKDVEEIKISCYGWSLAPIKQLLADAKALYFSDTSQRTTIYRPRSKEMRREHNMWKQVARRPVRPIRTVILDTAEKHSVLADVNEYLHPSTPRWYASRGIPLRRGYLFHGPPGTGKTSFSFALAGVFGIDIYVISLQDQSVTEEDLAILFTSLPRRCVVLLEDIDTAGLRRDPDASADATPNSKDKDKKGDKGGDGQTAGTLDTIATTETTPIDKSVATTTNATSEAPTTESADTKETKLDKKDKSKKKSKKNSKKSKSKKSKKSSKHDSDSDDDSDSSSSSDSSVDSESENDRRSRRKRGSRGNNRKGRSNKKAISLSGLLNAIDGVASHEGRVLIMTTNKPESLDEALVRPGRVDVQVGFGNATSTQAEELFERMYEAYLPKQPVKRINVSGSHKPTKAVSDSKGELAMQEKQAYELDVTPAQIASIAKQFGNKIPESIFSPAELQGFLLKRKKSPRKALEEIDAWVEGTMKQKEAKSKVATVQ